MIEHNLQKYLDLGTLVPTNTQVGSEVVNSEWWPHVSPMFDDLIWLYYGDRTVFLNKKFDPEDSSTTRENIRRTFGVYLKSRCRQLDRLWEGFMADFNPLWNVDGVEGFISKDTHTGTDTTRHTGTDRVNRDDTGNVTKSGNETNVSSGTDTSIDSNTTYNSSTFYDNDKNTYNHGKSDTHTYNQVRDTHDLHNLDVTTYNSQNDETRNLTDNHVDLKVRQGNIGVTKSTDLIKDNQAMYQDELMDFYKYVVRCCVNQVSYAVE